MKGTILDFNEELQTGKILGEDGNRYSFNIDEWKSKNKHLEIDDEVDFILEDNIATEIFSLTKKSNTNSNFEQNQSNLSSNINSNFKKIDFEEIENEINNPTLIEERKKKNTKDFFISTLVTFVFFIFLFISVEFKWNGFISIIILIFFISGIFVSIKELISIFIAKKQMKDDVIQSKYKDQLQIVNFTPNNLNFEIIKMIHVVDKTMDGVTKKLIEEAYELKADAIINYQYQSTTTSKVRTTNTIGASKDIKTDVYVSNIIDATAIRIIDK